MADDHSAAREEHACGHLFWPCRLCEVAAALAVVGAGHSGLGMGSVDLASGKRSDLAERGRPVEWPHHETYMLHLARHIHHDRTLAVIEAAGGGMSHVHCTRRAD